jgi:hypothetical protein
MVMACLMDLSLGPGLDFLLNEIFKHMLKNATHWNHHIKLEVNTFYHRTYLSFIALP